MHLVVDGLPAHKTTLVKAYVASTKGMLTLYFLPGRELLVPNIPNEEEVGPTQQDHCDAPRQLTRRDKATL